MTTPLPALGALGQRLHDRAQALTGGLIEIRRSIHRHPELGFEVSRTAGLVANQLRALGLDTREGVGRTGVVGLVSGGRPGPTVAVRADMDALPIEEATGLPFASTVPGRMHACGHDLHTAVLLGVATVLTELAPGLAGSVKLIFQPAEEVLAGARAMVADGVLGDPPVQAILGFHNWPALRVGAVGFARGGAMAASDNFDVEIHGVAGHAAQPHAAVDAVTAAAYFLTELQTVVSREIAPLHPAVVSVGRIAGGTAPNILPGTVRLEGTIRTLVPEARRQARQAIERVLAGIDAGLRAQSVFRCEERVGVLVNDAGLLDRVLAAARAVVGADHVEEMAPSMGAEDFASYTEHAPGAFIRIGSRGPGPVRMLHRDDYQPSEDAIPVGVEVMSRAAVEILGSLA